MVKVEIQANTAIKGVPVYHGDILDVDDADYRILASYQLAKPYIEEVKKEVIPQGLRKSTLVESVNRRSLKQESPDFSRGECQQLAKPYVEEVKKEVKIKESNKRKNKKGGKKK